MPGKSIEHLLPNGDFHGEFSIIESVTKITEETNPSDLEDFSWLVVSTHLKNISQNGFIFPIFSDENKKHLKPPPRRLIGIVVFPSGSAACWSSSVVTSQRFVGTEPLVVGFLRGGCSRRGGSRGTRRIPRKDWGTLGKIRGITTPPINNPITLGTSCFPLEKWQLFLGDNSSELKKPMENLDLLRALWKWLKNLLVGGFNSFETYYIVKMGIFPK